MKCAVCGKEFGNGANCKNCGTDRVTGLGNYSGYDAPSNSSKTVGSYSSRRENPQQIVDNEPKIAKVSSMICHACGEIIPADSKFCPHCSTSLYVTCPKCGHEYSSQYPACSKCGTNRQKYRDEELERIRKDILKRDREKKKREEWLKTPEGQAALKKEQDELRRRAEEAKRKRKEEEDRKRQEVEQETKMFNTIGLIVTALIALLVILGLLIDMNK